MKRYLFLSSILFSGFLFSQSGFKNLNAISPVTVTSSTADVTQSKTWNYAGKYWSVLASSTGTNIYRLDGSTWTRVLTLASGATAKADVKVVGNLAHIFTWKGIASYLYSVQYDVATGTYKLWTVRSSRITISLDSGVTSGTVDIDANGRMWLASNGKKSVNVRWSDLPYATWSAPITLATGLSTTDVCAVVNLPVLNKIGVFWSNKTTKRFGFKTHNNADIPASWSVDELPASQSAQNVNGGFADSQFNLKALSNGTLFSVVKTSYNQAGYPQLQLLQRQPNGSWGVPYTITTNEGTNPVITINETPGKISVFYTLGTQGIAYKTSSTNNISFGQAQLIINGAYDNSSTNKANYDSSIIVIASNSTTATGIVAEDNALVPLDTVKPYVTSIKRQVPLVQTTNASSVTFRVIFSEAVKYVDSTDFALIRGGNVNAVMPANPITEVSGSNKTTYDVQVSSITGNGSLQLILNASATGITDSAGNVINTGFNSGESYAIQQTTPTLASVSFYSNNFNAALAKPGEVVTLAFTGSEPLTNVLVNIATHAVIPVSGSGNSFVAQYTLTSSDSAGILPFSINFTNLQGTPGSQVSSTTNGSFVLFDKIIPSVVSIKRQVPLTQSTSASSITFRVLFSEPVTGVDTSDFILSIVSGTASGRINNNLVTVGSDGSTYDVSFDSVAGNGELRLDVKAQNTTIKDIAGNNIGAGFIAGETYTIVFVSTPPGGFTYVVPLQSLELSQPTKDKPQAKTWFYANKWWSVLSVAAGTKLFRLDGTAWTEIQLLTGKTSKPDCRIVGDLVHVLCYKGGLNNSYLYTLKYDSATNTYKPWANRPTATVIIFPDGSETATMDVDCMGRLWVASEAITDVLVWYSDAPYTSWSAAITIATNIKSDDICAITYIPALGKIGVFWSNQVTRRFGFRTHANGTDPALWSNDELPASQSALNVGYGMADDHINLKVANDGTLYCAAKTGYNKDGYAKNILLVRRPNGVWDNQYIVTMNPEGTQPNVLLNEQKQKIRVVYASLENGGDILYRESDMANISFGVASVLISNPGLLYDYVTSSHENFNFETIILATELTSIPQKAIGFLLRDDETPAPITSNAVMKEMKNITIANTHFSVFPNPFGSSANVVFSVSTTGQYALTLFSINGSRQTILSSGWAEKGVDKTVSISSERLAPGIYFVNLKTASDNKTLKIMIAK